MSYSEKALQIMDVAESMVRRGGYNNLSFRDIAAAVGIKSASVHYHFPTKADLARAIAERYTAQFMKALGEPISYETNETALGAYIDMYRTALTENNLMCLCGIMGAEIDILPHEVRVEAKRFFEENINWVAAVLASQGDPKTAIRRRERAIQIIAILEGAMLMSRALGEINTFESAVKAIY